MNKLIACSVFTLTVAAAPVAFAHPGHELMTGAIAGMMHPLSGVDHLMFLGGAGALLALASGRTRVSGGLLILAALLSGAMLGLTGWQLPALEWFIAASVVAVGAALAWVPFSRIIWVVGGTAFFAMFHGFAHGAEAGHTGTTFIAGFLLSSLVVMAAAMLLTRAFVRRAAVRGALGAAVGAGGLTLIGALLTA